jgi:hypothetical protein
MIYLDEERNKEVLLDQINSSNVVFEEMLKTYWEQATNAIGRILAYSQFIENVVTEGLRKYYVDGKKMNYEQFIKELKYKGQWYRFCDKNEEYFKLYPDVKLKRKLNWCRGLRNRMAHYSIDTSTGWEILFVNKKIKIKDIWKNRAVIITNGRFNKQSKRLYNLISLAKK